MEVLMMLEFIIWLLGVLTGAMIGYVVGDVMAIRRSAPVIASKGDRHDTGME